MSGNVPIITAGSISGMTGLPDRPVYFLRLNGAPAPNLVVKGDAPAHPEMTGQDAAVSIKWGSKMMKNVNNDQVNTKLMTPAEVALFKRAAVQAFANAPNQNQYRNVADANAPQYTWVKMPMVAGLSDAEYWKKNANGPGGYNLTPNIRQNITKFSDAVVWTDLGKVVAVDIFNGNEDRFDFEGHWVNKGNIMFVAGGQTAVIGLDTFNPFGGVRANLNSGGGFDELRILIDPARRTKFALACATSVGAELKRALAADGKHAITITSQSPEGLVNLKFQVETMDQLFVGYAPDFANGIAQGTVQLKAYLQNKLQKYANAADAARLRVGMHQRPGLPAGPVKTIPQGILDRMRFLGW